MTRTSRRPVVRTVAGLALAALALTGCGTNQLRTGAAAIVGDERISTEQLEAIVQRGLSDPAAAQANSDRAAYQRTVLTRLINTVILERAAAEAGVTVTEGDVDKQLQVYIASTPTGTLAELEMQAAQQAGIAKQDLRPFVRNVVIDQALADELTKDLPVSAATLREIYAQNPNYDKVRSAHVLLATKQQADSVLAQVKADPSQFAALAKKFSTDTSNKDKGGDLGLVGRGSFVKEFEDAVFAAKAGTVLTVKTQFGFHVVKVVERVTTSLAEATPELRRMALQEERDGAKSAKLRAAADALDIKVSPRFGIWSAAQGEVVERPSELSTPAPEGGEEPVSPDTDPNAPGGDPNAPGGDPNAPGQPGTDPNAPAEQPTQ